MERGKEYEGDCPRGPILIPGYSRSSGHLYAQKEPQHGGGDPEKTQTSCLSLAIYLPLESPLYLFIFIKAALFFPFIYLFLVALGLRCRAWAFSSCGERGLFFVVVHGLLIAVASLVAEHGL